jgi:hypothetical protein
MLFKHSVSSMIASLRRPREIGRTWLLGRVCTNGTFYTLVLFISHFSKQSNLAGSSLYALIIQVSRDLRSLYTFYVGVA